jgi:hypothetical protein
MKTYKFVIFGLLVVGGALLALPAFAYRGGDMTRASLRQELRTTALVKLEGALTIDNGRLMISDIRSGRSFGLVGAGDAMKLYDSGTRNVAIEGTLADASTINVSKVSAL